jgi:hypothetical protein
MGYYGPGSVAGGYVMAVAVAASSSVIVSGAGSAEADGLYRPRGVNAGKTYYNPEDEPDSTGVSAISWDGGAWSIYFLDGAQGYTSSEDVAEPWMVSEWLAVEGHDPAPVVTEA